MERPIRVHRVALVEAPRYRAASDLVGRRGERVAHRPVGPSGLLAGQLQLEAPISAGRTLDQRAVPEQLREQPEITTEVRVLRARVSEPALVHLHARGHAIRQRLLQAEGAL